MTITLTPEHERIVRDELRTGHFRTVEEVIGEFEGTSVNL